MKAISINANDLSTMCRLCLSSGVTVTDIFAFSNKMRNQIANVIMDCAPVQITNRDEMPNFICQLCCSQLENYHQFRMQVIESDKTLRHYLHSSDKQIKTECSIQELSNDALFRNINANTTVKCESLELHDVFDINVKPESSIPRLSEDPLLHNTHADISKKCESLKNHDEWKRNSPQQFNSATKNSNEVWLKTEIKDEPMDNNLFPIECTGKTLETISKCDRKIVCENPKINISNPKLDEGTCCANLKNDALENFKLADQINDNTLYKSEIKDEPMDEYAEDTEETLSKCDDVTENVDKQEEGTPVLTNREKHKTANIIKFYQCLICNKSFTNVSNLKRHERIHSGEKPYKCDVCNKCFNESQDLKIHKRTHTGEKPYKCDVCNKSFNQSYSLSCHKRTHTGEKPYKCDICNMCFIKAENLKMHKRTHTGEKPYKCDVCNMCFIKSQYLKIHKRTHTGEKPYQCDVCNKCFNQYQHLKIHRRTHTGEKPYKCDVCNKGFNHPYSLSVHKRTHTA